MKKVCLTTVESLEPRIAPARVAVLELAPLTADDGFRIGDRLSSMNAAGDVNGDGFADLVMGNSRAPNPANAGSVFVIFGSNGGFGEDFTVTALDGTNGFRIDGADYRYPIGLLVSGAGDVNGDGFDDLLVGAPYGGAGSSVYVVFGKAAGFPAVIEVSSLDGTNGFRIVNPTEHERFQPGLSPAGDINGDGFDDIAIGAYYHVDLEAYRGAVYVVFGQPTQFPAELSISELDGTNGFKLSSGAERDRFGSALANAGDVNGDGIDDLLIGAPTAKSPRVYSGAAYVIFGRSSSFPAELDASQLDGANGFRIDGKRRGEEIGFTVSGAGDVNGDGFADIVIGAPFSETSGFDAGAAYVIFGRAEFDAEFSLRNLGSRDGFRMIGEVAYDRFGRGVGGGGDINGDGFADLMVGAPHPGDDYRPDGRGAVYVIFGRPSFPATFDLSALNGKNGFRIDGNHIAGGIARDAGDFNGDGRDDILMNDGGFFGGGYVIFDRPAPPIIKVSGDALHYVEADGDRISVRVSSGTLLPSDIRLVAAGEGALLSRLDLTRPGSAIEGADVNITVKTRGNGDGLAEIGVIDARGLNLGRITVMGDLLSVRVGERGSASLSLKSLEVASLAKSEAHFGNFLHSIRIANDISKVKVAGDANLLLATIGGRLGSFVVGGSLTHSTMYVLGRIDPASPAEATAIGRFSVGGDFAESSLHVGHRKFIHYLNPDVRIGSIFIGGNFERSDIVAGAHPGFNSWWGDDDDALIEGGSAIVAKIASVIIQGTVLGNEEDVGPHYGIVAEEIGKLIIGEVTQPLTPGPRNDLDGIALSGTDDVRAREVK